MGLGGLQHYTIEPSDLERTKDFYCDVLGLENGDRCRGHAHASAVEGRQIPREHSAAHRRYAVLPLRSRWRRRRTELSENLRPLSRRGSEFNSAGSVPAGLSVVANAHLMLVCNTVRQRLKFPTTPQVSHDQGASPSGFLHHCNEIGEAAPLRQSSRVPRLSTYPRACVPGYSSRGAR